MFAGNSIGNLNLISQNYIYTCQADYYTAENGTGGNSTSTMSTPGGSNTGLIVGVVVGCIAALVLLVLCAWLCYVRWRRVKASEAQRLQDPDPEKVRSLLCSRCSSKVWTCTP